MIAFITGTIEEKSENGVVINCNGMGYEVQTSTATLSSLPLVGEECKIYTYLQVKEDGISLFGFTTVDERELFYKLISVSGVGPKMAITVLSGMNISDLIVSILKEDTTALSRIKGLGKKTAQKIIIDLKDKMKNETLLPEGWEETPQEMTGAGPKTEALEALLALGYSRSEAVRALANLPQEDTESLLKAALKRMLQ